MDIRVDIRVNFRESMHGHAMDCRTRVRCHSPPSTLDRVPSTASATRPDAVLLAV